MARSSRNDEAKRGPLTSAEVPLAFEPYVTKTETFQASTDATESAEEAIDITKPVPARSSHPILMLQRGPVYSQC
jgi:hypothetical protein